MKIRLLVHKEVRMIKIKNLAIQPKLLKDCQVIVIDFSIVMVTINIYTKIKGRHSELYSVS